MLVATAVASISGLTPPATDARSWPWTGHGAGATISIEPSIPAAIVRRRVQRFDVESAARARTRVEIEVLILGTAGRAYGELTLYHDQYRKIKKLSGRVRDGDGRVVMKLKKDHVEDVSAVSGASLYEEGRYRTARLYHGDYPYTVEFTYEIEHSGLLNWPVWYPGSKSAFTEYTRFEIAAPASMPIRYVTSGLIGEPEISVVDGEQSLVWEMRGLEPFEPEPWGPSWEQQQSAVMTAPSQFEIDGVPGEMTSWSGFAKWYGDLMAGRDRLPEPVAATIRELTSGVEDPVERARIAYEFMQDRTRYISVQLGLGRWQPQPAEIVHDRGYGDCKALTNYTLALLREAGVVAYPALIRNGLNEPPLLPDFPCNQFNHVILYLPTTPNSVWLECTSQTKPFGHIGASNENRYALVVKPGGGELLRTPTSPASSNRQHRTAVVSLKGNGDATADVKETYTGNRADMVRGALDGSEPSWREELRDMIDLPNFAVVSAERLNDPARRDTVGVRMDLDLPRLASRSGSRLFSRPNLMQRWTAVPPDVEKRTQPVVFSYAFVQEDSLLYSLPESFQVETLPDVVELSTPFASYRSRVTHDADGGTITYSRMLQIDELEIPPEAYGDVSSFFAEIANADSRQVVLKRSSGGLHNR